MPTEDASLLALFEEEAKEHLETLESDLLALEKNPGDTDLVNKLFRAMHSIKGGAGFAGLNAIGSLSHAAENVMMEIRDGRLAASHDVVDALLSAGDKLNTMVGDLMNSETVDMEADLAALSKIQQAGDGEEQAAAETVTPEAQAAEEPVEQEPGQVAARDDAQVAEETIRVPVRLLDQLVAVAGEMVLGRNQLMRVTEGLEDRVQGLPAILHNINLLTSELQEKVMRTRMQPLRVAFSKFTRVVRDIAKELHKEIRLETSGGNVEMDKSLLEMLSTPLMHLVRNCADHAIESPDQRRALGKPVAGTIELSARHAGGQVHVEIADDGRGIDADKLRSRAVERGLLPADTAETLTDHEAMDLIFQPGFSTAKQVGKYSGRGVGMDVVKTNVEQMNGSISIESRPGKGTRVTLSVPLTLAIMPVMLVKTAGRLFAIARDNQEEIVRLGGERKIEQVQGADVLRLRGRLLPIINLREVLGLPDEEGTAGKACYVMVLKTDRHRFGLTVDSLLDGREIVVKALSKYLKGSRCYSGATVLGDGRLAMILDIPGLADLAGMKPVNVDEWGPTDEEIAQQIAEARKEPILLFRNGTRELFALNLEFVRRIERIDPEEIELVGEKEFIKIDGDSMRILRLHNFCSVSKPDASDTQTSVIVPKLVSHPMGIVATKVEDVIWANVSINRENISEQGILGTAVINGDMAVFIDVYGLFEKAEPAIYTPKLSGGAAVLSGKRILLVEDAEVFRVVESQYLRAFGCDVHVVPDGEAAWERLNTTSYDMLLTDLDMPGMDGFELARRVRQSDRLKGLPVVALSSFGMREIVRKTEEIGVDAFERKLDRDHLQATLEKLLQQRRSLGEAIDAESESRDAGTEKKTRKSLSEIIAAETAKQEVTEERIASAKTVEVEVTDEKKPRRKKKKKSK